MWRLCSKKSSFMCQIQWFVETDLWAWVTFIVVAEQYLPWSDYNWWLIGDVSLISGISETSCEFLLVSCGDILRRDVFILFPPSFPLVPGWIMRNGDLQRKTLTGSKSGRWNKMKWRNTADIIRAQSRMLDCATSVGQKLHEVFFLRMKVS